MSLVINLEDVKRTQIERASLVDQSDCLINPKTLLAVAISQQNSKIRGGGILYSLEYQKQIDSWIGDIYQAPYPYVSTFLSLRNKSSLIEVIKAFWGKFDLVLVEGAGVQHPRYFGLACELGVDLDISVIGITRNSLWGEINMSYPVELRQVESEHEIFPVYDKEKLLAYFIRRKNHKKGLYLSIGHKISLRTALEIILLLIVNKLPEPLRLVKSLLKEK